MNTVDVLQGAKEILTQRGWTKGTYHSMGSDCFCAEGAVMEAGGCLYDWTPNARNWEAVTEALVLLDNLAAERMPMGNIVRFNDQQESVEPVLEILDEAIARAVAS